MLHVHAHLYNLNMWLILWTCSRKVEAVLLDASIPFLNHVMLNLCINSNRNKTVFITNTNITLRPMKVKATLIKMSTNNPLFLT